MPTIRPISAICYSPRAVGPGGDVSPVIAPPYDVLDEGPKRELLARCAHNIVAIDLPFTPPKVVGPDAVYQQAGQTYRAWLAQGLLAPRPRPAVYVYEQAYRHAGRDYRRRGLIANVQIQPFSQPGAAPGGIWAHEHTFSSGKEDRLKLMRACQAQLSPIFGLYSDPAGAVRALLDAAIAGGPPTFHGTTATDGVLHRVWEISDPAAIACFTGPLSALDFYIADGHHRYNTALNYRNEVAAARGPLAPDDPANFCLFVLVAMQDPGMIVLPTHRVLGGMAGFTFARFAEAARGKLDLTPFAGRDLAELEQALPAATPAGGHAFGVYVPAHAEAPLWIATTLGADPLAATHAAHAPAWRQLDVALVQHLIVEQICQPRFCAEGQSVQWKFPHTLAQLQADVQTPPFQLGLVLQPTPLGAVMEVSRAGELMPQKSTFFYPKLATGLVINPL